MGWVLDDIRELSLIMLDVVLVLWLCIKLIISIFLDIRAEKFRVKCHRVCIYIHIYIVNMTKCL